MKEKFQKLISGRYGPDSLNSVVLVLSLLLLLIFVITKVIVILLAAYLLLAVVLLRSLSRNIVSRRKENDRFLKFYWPVKQKVKTVFRCIFKKKKK